MHIATKKRTVELASYVLMLGHVFHFLYNQIHYTKAIQGIDLFHTFLISEISSIDDKNNN